MNFFVCVWGGGGGGRGGRIGNDFFLKQIFLRVWRRDSCVEEISPAKIFWRIFISKISL